MSQHAGSEVEKFSSTFCLSVLLLMIKLCLITSTKCFESTSAAGIVQLMTQENAIFCCCNALQVF